MNRITVIRRRRKTMTDMELVMEQAMSQDSFSVKVKTYFLEKRDELVATLKHWLRVDGFPTKSVLAKRGPLPKVMTLYYFCASCEMMVEVNRHLECEICGCGHTRPVHKAAEEKHDIFRIIQRAQIEIAHGEGLRRNEQAEMEKALEGSM
jgi:hypothetical protein